MDHGEADPRRLDRAALVHADRLDVLLPEVQAQLVRADDLSRLNMAFFTTNAYVSVILFVTIATDIFLIK